VRVYNDGEAANTMALQGSGAQVGSTVRYFDEGADVTVRTWLARS
jgi:hypothetical protein